MAGVLLFHAGFSWAVGGYLGVSAFFTLSGFLITTLLLTEHARSGSIDLAGFWIRRARRLLPAALLGITAAVAYVLVFGDATAIGRARLDALAALGYVANWRFIVSDLSYAELFTGDSPLQHLWSLAIEEQFYVFLPLLAVAAFRDRSPTRRLGELAAAGLALSVVASLLLGGDTDRLYYGTDTRAAELLVGVLLACIHHSGAIPRLVGRQRDRLGLLALLGMGALWVLAEQSWSLLHPWGLLAHAGLTGLVVLAAIGEGGTARALSVRPLVALGRISYGVYLFHWPIYLWLDEARTGLDGAPLLALRVAVTLAVSVASYRLVEAPIRYGVRRRPRWELAGAGVALGLAASLVAVSTTVVDRDPLVDFAAAEEAMHSLATTPPAPRDVASPTTEAPAASPMTVDDAPVTDLPAVPAQPKVAIFGDSTALLFVPGLLDWSARTGELQLVEGYAVSGCGLTRHGVRVYADWVDEMEPGCIFSDVWPAVLERGQPDVALVELGLWDIVDRRLPGSDAVVAVGDPAYDDYLRAELDAAADVLLEQTDMVVWVLQPPPVRSSRADDDPVFERIEAFNDLIAEHFADRPEVALVDVAAWLAQHPEGTDSLRLRPDGTHFSEATSVELAEWLGPAILRATQVGGRIGPDDVPTADPAR